MYLSDLVARLESEVAAVNGTPSAEQYETCIKDAVKDFSERCGTEKIATLNIVSGTSTYSLPDDFLEMIQLADFSQDGRVMVTSQGILPLGESYEERYLYRFGAITIYPTPSYTMARDYRYKAGWALTTANDEYASEEYADLGEREARIVLLKAKQKAMDLIARAQMNAGGLKYSLGAVTIDKGANTSEQTKSAFALHAEFVDACDKYNGTRLTA